MQHDDLPSQAVRADAPAGRIIPQDPDALLFQSEAAYLTGLSPRTFEAMRMKGGGPRFIVVGRRAVRYCRRDLMEWIESRRRQSTSDLGAGSAAGRRELDPR